MVTRREQPVHATAQNRRVATVHRRRGCPPAVAAVLALALVLLGCQGEARESGGPGSGDPAPLQAQDVDQARSVLAEEVADRREQSMAGATLEIPAIGVSAPVTALGLNEDRTMEVPTDFAEVGWYRYGPTPGEVGPAVLAGHVDDHTGPAVFFRLADLEPGDEVHVRRADGTTASFQVRRVEQHPKDAFPHDAVYGDTDEPALRLITCGGVFDRAERSHRDNIIVYADHVGS